MPVAEREGERDERVCCIVGKPNDEGPTGFVPRETWRDIRLRDLTEGIFLLMQIDDSKANKKENKSEGPSF